MTLSPKVLSSDIKNLSLELTVYYFYISDYIGLQVSVFTLPILKLFFFDWPHKPKCYVSLPRSVVGEAGFQMKYR